MCCNLFLQVCFPFYLQREFKLLHEQSKLLKEREARVDEREQLVSEDKQQFEKLVVNEIKRRMAQKEQVV